MWPLRTKAVGGASGDGVFSDGVFSDGVFTDDVDDRLTMLMRVIRWGTLPFLVLPLAVWPDLERPWIVIVCLCAATAEALYFSRRSRGGVTVPLAVTDSVFCMALMLAGSRAVVGHERNVLMTELVPFSLASAAAVGLSRTRSVLSIVLVGGLMTAWVLALYPNLTIKLASDLLGFAIWFAAGRFVGDTWRELAGVADRVQAESNRRKELAAEYERQRLIDRAEDERRQLAIQYREMLHQQLHDNLLPVVELVAAERPIDAGMVSAARQAVAAARHPDRGDSFASLLKEVLIRAAGMGLQVEDSIQVTVTPPSRLAAAAVSATIEALNNVSRHAGVQRAVLAAHDQGAGFLITVRDRGPGFDVMTTRVGGGLGTTFESVRRNGGFVKITSSPGYGSKIEIGWLGNAGASIGSGGELEVQARQ